MKTEIFWKIIDKLLLLWQAGGNAAQVRDFVTEQLDAGKTKAEIDAALDAMLDKAIADAKAAKPPG